MRSTYVVLGFGAVLFAIQAMSGSLQQLPAKSNQLLCRHRLTI